MTREAALDRVDEAILRALQLDARTKYSDIAQTQDVSVDTIIKRFRKLKRNGVIKRTTLLLDPRRLGLVIVATLAMTVEPNGIDEVVDYIQRRSGVLFATHSVGQYDVFAVAATRTMNEMNTLKEHIQGHGKVKDVKASIWVDQFLLCPQNFELEPLLEAQR